MAKKDKEKTLMQSDKFIGTILSLATLALVAQATFSVKTYAEIAVIKLQTQTLINQSSNYVQRSDLDNFTEIQNMKLEALTNRVTKIETNNTQAVLGALKDNDKEPKYQPAY